MADLAKDEKERTANIGLVSAVFGMGFLLGPVVGAVLSQISHSAPFWMAGGLAAGNAIVAVFVLPETHHRRDAGRALSVNPLRPLRRAIEDRILRPFYLTWLAFALAFVSGQSVFALFTKDIFGFTAFDTGMAFTFIGVVVLVNQTALLKRFWLPRFGEVRLIRIMLWILALGLIGVGSQNLTLFFIGLVGLGTGQAVLRVVVTSQVSGLGGQERKGETIGVLSSIMSASMVVAPPVVGVLFEVGPSLPYVLAVAIVLAGIVLTRGLPAQA
jgi:DHA1 family tetracycline resistance protein-like MFS transporter